MSDEADRKGLSIFDNAATGGFHVRSRGYDREQVVRYVRKFEDQLNEALSAAHADFERKQDEKQTARIAEISAKITK